MNRSTCCCLGFLSIGLILGGFSVQLACSKPADNRFERSCYNLKQIRRALQNYRSDFGAYPPRFTSNSKGRLLSWRVLLLPYLNEKLLYDQFALDEPWNSEQNLRLSKRIPKWLAVSEMEPVLTHCVMVYSESSTALDSDFIVMLSPVQLVVWTEPADCDETLCREIFSDTLSFSRTNRIPMHLICPVLSLDDQHIVTIPIEQDYEPYEISKELTIEHCELINALFSAGKDVNYEAIVERFRLR